MLKISSALIIEGLKVKRVENNTIFANWSTLTVSALFDVFSLIKFLMYTFFPCAWASLECKPVLHLYVIELNTAHDRKEEFPEKVALFAAACCHQNLNFAVKYLMELTTSEQFVKKVLISFAVLFCQVNNLK